MATAYNPRIVDDGLVLYLDAASGRSFRGEPTTNLVKIQSDYTGVAYGPDNQWIDTTIGKQYDPSVPTPIGFGATLLSESSTNGWQALSRFGGGGSGNFCLSAFIRPVDSDLVTMQMGLLAGPNVQFNLQTRQITYNSMPASPRFAIIEDVLSHPGWLRVAANLVGRSGGWVGSIGYRVDAFSAGTGTKRMYITGLQYETTPKTTRYLLPLTSRGTTVATSGGWADMSGNEKHGELVGGVSYDGGNGGSLDFDGTDDYTLLSSTITFGNGNWTVGMWINADSLTSYNLMSNNSGGPVSNAMGLHANKIFYRNYSGVWNDNYGNTSLSQFTWYYLTWVNYAGATAQDGTMKMFVNGISDSSIFNSYTSNGGPCNSIGRNWFSYFNGRISGVQVYNRSLNEQEIQQNFNATRGRFGI